MPRIKESIIVRNVKYISPRVKKLRKYFIFVVFSLLLIFSLFVTGYYLYLARNLPSLDSIVDYRPKTVTEVFSRDGAIIGEFFLERRKVLPYSAIPDRLVKAFVAAEDDRFYDHEGLDFFSIFRALVKNILVGEVVQGGSTITQQMAKSLLSSEKTLKRKTREAILAYRIERKFSKNDILYLYLNEIYLGHGAYGIQAAAENYFRKEVHELNLAEMAMLAGLPQAPSKYSPYINPDMARERQFYVLFRMVDEGYINIVEATDAMNTEVKVYPVRDINATVAPYFTEFIRQHLEKAYGPYLLYSQGMKVFTTLNLSSQKAAQKALQKGLNELDRRQGYRGVVRNVAVDEIAGYLAGEAEKVDVKQGALYEGVVLSTEGKNKSTIVGLGGEIKGKISLEEIRWARPPDPDVVYSKQFITDPSQVFSVGDVVRVKVESAKKKNGFFRLSLHQKPMAQAAILSINPENGFITTMVGGLDFKLSKYNRAVQSRRQPGSAFKPIVFATAIEKGYKPESIIRDVPFRYTDRSTGFVWTPKNYDGLFLGPVTLRTALRQSRNIVSIRLAKKIGIGNVIDYARKMGIESELSRNLSLSLGSSGVSLLELTSAYSVFASGGKKLDPTFIVRVLDRNGSILMSEDKKNKEEEAPFVKDELDGEERGILPEGYVISPGTARVMTSLLEDVVQRGTAKRAKVLNRPVAGKTGTTDENRDAWFVGYTPSLVAGVWVGFDDRRSLGKKETGSRAALPIFVGFMKEIYEGKPVEEFSLEEEILKP